MDTENDHRGECAVLRVIAGRVASAAPADPERECSQLSAAEIQRFLKGANETDPDSTARVHRRAGLTRALLTLALIALAGLAAFLTERREEGTAEAAELIRLQREVCRRALQFTQRTPNPLESVCQPRP